jgi:glutathione reductase (NADPH)
VIYRGDNILRGFDEDVRAHVRSEMEKQGITILTGCTVVKVERHGDEFTTDLSNGSSLASDQVMFAIGRHPAVANLGLEKVGVAINPKNGGIAVDHFSKSSVDSIYAIGDVTHRFNLTPVAIREGHALADTVFGKREVQVDHSQIPSAVFSQPEVGTVGLTETEARAQFSQVAMCTVSGVAAGHRRLDRAKRSLVDVVTSSSVAVGCSAMVASKSALVAFIFKCRRLRHQTPGSI